MAEKVNRSCWFGAGSVSESMSSPYHSQEWKKILCSPRGPNASLAMLKSLLSLKGRKTVLPAVEHIPVEAQQLTWHPVSFLPPDPSSSFSFHLTRLPSICCYLRHLWTFSCPLARSCVWNLPLFLYHPFCPCSRLGRTGLKVGTDSDSLLIYRILPQMINLGPVELCGQNSVLKRRLEANSLRTFFHFISCWSAFNVHNLTRTLM